MNEYGLVESGVMMKAAVCVRRVVGRELRRREGRLRPGGDGHAGEAAVVGLLAKSLTGKRSGLTEANYEGGWLSDIAVVRAWALLDSTDNMIENKVGT